jgi:hypothetical protein
VDSLLSPLYSALVIARVLTTVKDRSRVKGYTYATYIYLYIRNFMLFLQPFIYNNNNFSLL